MSQDIKIEESLAGFRKLHALLSVQKEGYAKCGKVFAVRHTEDFIRHLDDIIRKLEENLEQAELQYDIIEKWAEESLQVPKGFGGFLLSIFNAEIVIDTCFLGDYNQYKFRKHINADNMKRISIGGFVI